MGAQSQDPGFWDNASRAAEIMSERGRYESKLGQLEAIEGHLGEVSACLELFDGADEGAGAELLSEAVISLGNARSVIEALELVRMLGSELDSHDAVVSINAGAGGTE